MHLERVKQLSDREWRTMVLFWGALLASGTGLITASANASVSLATIIAHWDWLIIVSYYASATIYLVGYNSNMHRSLVTERNRYQLLQDQAFDLRGLDPKLRMKPDRLLFRHVRRRKPFCWLPRKVIQAWSSRNAFAPVRRRQGFLSGVWGVKVMTTSLFITVIWAVSQLRRVEARCRANEATVDTAKRERRLR